MTAATPRVAHGTSLTPRAHPDGMPAPAWVERVVDRSRDIDPSWFSRFLPPRQDVRMSGVLLLFGPGPGGEESLVLIERSHTLRSHAGQVAFPGGRVDPEDADVVAAALREAVEEISLDVSGVEVVGALPALYLPVSDNAVTPVVAWWERPAPVHVGHPDEVARVLSVPLDYLVEPAHRHTVVAPTGWRGPAWELGDGLLLWGFTAGIVDKVLDLAGLALPWDQERTEPVPERFLGRRS
mgnify:CR=1 FL=1